MSAIARLLDQRSVGHVHVRMEREGVAIMHESGSAKCRMPRGTHEAILINTSGGLAGGDTVSITAEAGEGASLTLTSQAAERVYRTLGPPAEVNVALIAKPRATLFWMPQESIFYEGSALRRRLDVELADDASFFAVEPMIFGRREMGEQVARVSVQDRWAVRQSGKLVHAEAFTLGPDWPQSKATLGSNHAIASLIWISPLAESRINAVREVLSHEDGASAWNGKLVARLLAKDSFHLRKTLIQVFSACVGREKLPKCWSF